VALTLEDFWDPDDRDFILPQSRADRTVYARRYTGIPRDATTLIPAEGDALMLRGLTDVSATPILIPRAMRVTSRHATGKERSGIVADVVWYQVRCFVAGTPDGASYTELATSRSNGPSGQERSAVRIFVSVNGLADLPASVGEGMAYPGDSVLGGRTAMPATDDVNSMPGLHRHTIHFGGFRSASL
jgi:hypothetical protein